LDFVQYTAKAYNLLLLLVDVMLRVVFGPFRMVTIIILTALLAGLGLLFWMYRRYRRPPDGDRA
jgi:hypothetical protein